MFRHSTFWTNLTGALLLAIVTATPILMSSVMDRGYEITKLSLAEPFAFFALASILLGQGWRSVCQISGEARIASGSFLAFLLVACISTAMSEHHSIALFGGYTRRDGLLAWAAYAAFFFAVLGWARAQTPNKIASLFDVLLLASVIPGVYAIQQRLGLDFFFVANRDLARSGGTLGNPVFLGAYFAVLLPVAAVRCWQARERIPELALWLMIVLLQCVGLLITQSRGPLLACIVGLALLACLGAGYRRSRRIFVVTGMLLLIVPVGVFAVNMHGAAQRWAQEVPIISRFVYNPENVAGTTLSSGTRSTTARLGIWEAANETFLDAPALSKWIGFGPESAYTRYFPHVPDSVMQVDGYLQSDSYDRFHAETLDIGLNFGILGWLAYYVLFCSVFFAAGCALFGIADRRLRWLFAVLPPIGGSVGAALAATAGLSSVIAPAVGLGIGVAWLILFLVDSWLALLKGTPENLRSRSGLWMLLAGLTSSLLVFWMDAQVNIPVPTTRLISLGIAALVIVIASILREPLPVEIRSFPAANQWGIALPIIAACASFLPAIVFESAVRTKEAEHWWLCTIPIGMLMVFGVLHTWIRCPMTAGRSKEFGRWLVVALGLPAVYALFRWALLVRVGPVLGQADVLQLAVTTGMGAVYILMLCIASSWIEAQKSVAQCHAVISRFSLVAAAPALAMALIAAAVAWNSIKADVGSVVAVWASDKQRDAILVEAIRVMPYERQYQRQRTFGFLGHAMEDIKRFGASPDHFPRIKLNLDAAERQARESLQQFPNDPWIILALANVLQIRALPVVQSLSSKEGHHAALEADKLFGRAYEIFPNQPLLLRNWAQLRFNGGDHWGAYRLLDRMEGIIPNEVEPYSERITMARQLNDSFAISEAIGRAEKNLDRSKLDQLLAVAGLQQQSHEK